MAGRSEQALADLRVKRGLPALYFLISAEEREASQVPAIPDPKELRVFPKQLPSSVLIAYCALAEKLDGAASSELGVADLLEVLEAWRAKYFELSAELCWRLAAGEIERSEEAGGQVERALAHGAQVWARAYAKVLRAVLAGQGSWLQRRRVETLLFRTLRALVGCLIAYFVARMRVPAWLWYDIHSLYRYSVRIGRSQDKVKDETLFSAKSISVQEVYAQALLLHIANPERLSVQEILDLAIVLESGAGHVELELVTFKPPRFQWLVNTAEDRPPLWGDELNDFDPESALYRLDPAPLLTIIERNPAQYVDGSRGRFEPSGVNTSFRLNGALFAYLQKVWRRPGENDSWVPDEHEDFLMAVELRGIHQMLHNDPGIGETVVGEWLVERGTGASFLAPMQLRNSLRVGTLVGLRRLDGSLAETRLGVVNRLSVDDAAAFVRFEVRLIARAFMAVGIQPASLLKDRTIFQRALMIEGAAVSQPSQILLESHPREGAAVRLLTPRRVITCQLGNRRSVAWGSYCYDCQTLPGSPLFIDIASMR